MSCWSLTAIKSRSSCKTRLAGCLSPALRRELANSMLAHVLSVLQRTPAVDRLAVVSPECAGLPEHVIAFTDPAQGLNESLISAARSAYERGATRLVIVHADLPFLRPDEVAALIAAAATTGLAIAPDHRNRGTNALCMALPAPVPFRFGPESLERHLAEAAAHGISARVVRLPGLGFDVDDASDLRAWAACDETVALP